MHSMFAAAVLGLAGSPWTRVGPWNIYDDVDDRGEAGTLACAASPAAYPDLIYAGGQNNGVSSGILKSTDGGKHWMRKSKGLWDTRILGVWVVDTNGTHVLAGTHSGVYESFDAAETWVLCNETASWGRVMSFRAGRINGTQYILANAQGGILTRPWNATSATSPSTWTLIKSPGGIAPNAHLSVVTPAVGNTEILTCIGGWGGGQLYYANLTNASNASWQGPVTTIDQHYATWQSFDGQSLIWGRCKAPSQCDKGVYPLGQFGALEDCQRAVNATHNFTVATYTYQRNMSSLGKFAGWCYALSEFVFEPRAQADVVSGRGPGTFPGAPIDCANAAVDPHDRNHFLFSKGGKFTTWESTDGGRTVHPLINNTHAAYFVMIDASGRFYTATQAGAFGSDDGGVSWQPFHVIMHTRDGRLFDRVPHDYQRIVPDFRGDQIALPSDQGLHIVNSTRNSTGHLANYTLISAVGDLHNNMALSAIISPSTTTPGSRNLVVNLWDWDVGASWNDGATWAGWKKGEKSPGSCGEGGGGQGLGASGHAVMFHRLHWYSSSDGGHNWDRGDLPGGAYAFVYLRKVDSRSEPNGTCFALMSAPPGAAAVAWHRAEKSVPVDQLVTQRQLGREDKGREGYGYRPDDVDGDDDDHGHDDPYKEVEEEMDPWRVRYTYEPGMDLGRKPQGNTLFLLRSDDFGQTWQWKALPVALQGVAGLAVDPTSSSRLYAMTGNCLASSADLGATWSNCSTAPGLKGAPFSQLLVKNSEVMFLLRKGAVPLRTTDGGAHWYELSTCAALFAHGATMDGSLSWSGSTLVLNGFDPSAIGRRVYGTHVWKSINDGETWDDETGDLVTISPGPGVWYERDFYLITRGEGVTVKRAFDPDPSRG